MKKIILYLFLFVSLPVNSIDLTNKMSEKRKFEKWQVIEFLGSKQLLYRLATTSINEKESHIVFDFLPSKKCIPSAALMIQKLESYKKISGKGLLILSFKFPKEKEEDIELIKTESQKNDSFLFIQFKKLTIGKFKNSKDKGKLAIWVPKGHKIRRSSNIYFSLNGFSSAYSKAKELCMYNI